MRIGTIVGIWAFPKLGVPFGVLGSSLGSPHFGKLPYIYIYIYLYVCVYIYIYIYGNRLGVTVRSIPPPTLSTSKISRRQVYGQSFKQWERGGLRNTVCQHWGCDGRRLRAQGLQFYSSSSAVP